MAKALITGITGQDGFYLAFFLHGLGYEVHGTVRSIILPNSPDKILVNSFKELESIATLYAVPLDDLDKLAQLITIIQPDQIYHLAGPSIVHARIEDEADTFRIIVSSIKRILDTMVQTNSNARLFFAGSSEIFDTRARVGRYPQDLSNEHNPRTVYGLAKLIGYETILYYRKRYNIFACTGVLYNHESPRRSIYFISRKVTNAVARIALGLQEKLFLGNIEAERDWGYAPEYVKAMWQMLNYDVPLDFIIATGMTHTVRQLIDVAFSSVDLNYKNYIEIDPKYYRPKEIVPLCGNPEAIRSTLGWQATMKFENMIEAMVQHDISLLKM